MTFDVGLFHLFVPWIHPYTNGRLLTCSQNRNNRLQASCTTWVWLNWHLLRIRLLVLKNALTHSPSNLIYSAFKHLFHSVIHLCFNPFPILFTTEFYQLSSPDKINSAAHALLAVSICRVFVEPPATRSHSNFDAEQAKVTSFDSHGYPARAASGPGSQLSQTTLSVQRGNLVWNKIQRTWCETKFNY